MSDCKLIAYGDRVIVELKEIESKTETGLYLPSNVKLAQQEAIVVAVGTGKLLKNGQHTEMCVAVGDNVIVDQQYGAEIRQGDKTYLIFEHDNILAKIGDED